MKALTICQPYAHLICLPGDDIRAKRVENRVWPTRYRGELIIHAGKNRKFLSAEKGSNFDWEYGIQLSSSDFGAIVGIATLADCVGISIGPNGSKFHNDSAVRTRWPWLHAHQHVEGPYCFVLTNVRRLLRPILYTGAQGLFDVVPSTADEVSRQLKHNEFVSMGEVTRA